MTRRTLGKSNIERDARRLRPLILGGNAPIVSALADHLHSGTGDGGHLVVGTTDTNATAGSVFFAGAGGLLQEDNAGLFWDDANDRLGVGTASPDVRGHIALDDASDDSVLEVLRIERTTSSVTHGAAGIGARIGFELEDDGGDLDVLAGVEGVATKVTAGAEEGALRFLTADVGDDGLIWRAQLDHDGNFEPVGASGQALGDGSHLWDLHTLVIRFGGGTGTNEMQVGDSLADAWHLEDVGGIEYIKVTSTDAQPVVTFNDGGADIDLTVKASGVADALLVQGADGQITLGALGAGVVQTDASGVLSSGTIDTGDISDLAYGTPGLTFSTANAAGAANTVMRTDATLALFDVTVPTTIQCDDAAATGAAGVAARRDHAHGIVCAVVGNIAPDDAAAEGTATSFARSDHTHSITCAVAGNIQPDDTAAEGSAVYFARSDHTHGIVCAAPGANLSVSTTNAEGVATSFARSDHSHAITSSSNPGAAASLLASDASGYLQLTGLGLGTAATAASRLTLGDADTYIDHPAADQISVYAGGVHMAHFVEGATDYVNLPAGLLFLNETSNANMAQGITINQGANDDEIVNCRSSDVGGVYNAYETNTYLVAQKYEATSGGAQISGLKDSDGNNRGALLLRGFLAEAPDTTKTTAGRGVVEVWAHQTDGTDPVNTAADGNLFMIGTRRGGGNVTVLLTDEDGDLLIGGTYGTLGDVDTYISFPAADQMAIHAGGVEMLTFVEDAADAVTVNDGAADVDFTVKANGVADALVMQGSDGQITLGALGLGLVQSTAGGVLSSSLTIANSIKFDDGAGDSPSISFVGGSNNDTAWIYLDDDAAAGKSDLIIKLCDAAGFSQIKILDSASATMAYLNSDGHLNVTAITTDDIHWWEGAGYAAGQVADTGYISLDIDGTTYKLLARLEP